MMGHVAVDVFFVLSGFILTLVYRDLIGPGSKEFALRRICRIYPLHLCIMTLLGVAGLYTALSTGTAHPWADFWPTLLLVQPYLDITSAWNLPSWSLGVELICYVLFPLANIVMRSAKRTALITFAILLTIAEPIYCTTMTALWRARARYCVRSQGLCWAACSHDWFCAKEPCLRGTVL